MNILNKYIDDMKSFKDRLSKSYSLSNIFEIKKDVTISITPIVNSIKTIIDYYTYKKTYY